MLFLVISEPRPEPPSSVTGQRKRYWDWVAPLRKSGEVRSIHAKVGRGAVALFDVGSNDQLHQRLNEWADIIPAHFQIHALIDPDAAQAFLQQHLSEKSTMATGPLEGMRVLDFTTTIAGPYCTRLMADLGAEVIKIETSEGDMMRTRPPLRDGASTSFGQLNAGKHSIVLDLKRPEAQEVVRRLLTTCDFVVENFRPGVMRRFGLDYETVSKRHQELIYCSISGYGQTGPSSGLAAYAPAIHAASGFDLAHMAYQPGRDRPDNCGIYIADIVSGTYAFGAIMAALAQRHLTGLGQHIDVSMLETMLTLMVGEVQAAQFPVVPPGRPMFGPVKTKDGFIMPAVASEKTFQSLCHAAGRPEWITDPRFARYSDRRNNWGDLVDLLETWSATVTTAECQAAFDAAGVPNSPYRTVKEVLADPQLGHRGALTDVSDTGGSFKVVNSPFRLSAARVQVARFAPSLAEHTREILELAGYAPEEIEKMSAEGTVFLP